MERETRWEERTKPSRTRIARRFAVLGAVVSVGAILLLLAVSPPVRALSIGPTYQTQCYGTQQGTVYPIKVGTYGGGTWSNTNSSGTLTLNSQTASSPPNSNYETAGWISMGPGPTAGLCFSPSSTSTTLTYTFHNVDYTVDLSASCAGDHPSASASYTLTLQGDIYDLTTASFVWGTGHLNTLVGTHTISCPPNPPVYLKTFTNAVVTVSGSTTGLSTSDQYWFIVDALLDTQTASSNTASTASSIVSGVSMTLSNINCPAC